MKDVGDPIVNFGEDISYGCGKSLSLSELASYCTESSKIASLPIFTNVNFWTVYGQFGNANIYNPSVSILIGLLSFLFRIGNHSTLILLLSLLVR